MGLNVKGVDASTRFLGELAGISDPETKRKTIGRVFIEVFDDESHQIEDVKWLAQGTIYPDVIESVSVKGPSATIKSHHNVGGLPDYMKLQIVDLCACFSRMKCVRLVPRSALTRLYWAGIRFPDRVCQFVSWVI
jgi:GMP synthase (glutamine-hydrolysing) B subunit